MRANYAGEVTMVDRWLGNFMNALEATGRAKSTLVVLVSDHRHYLGEHLLTGKIGYPMCREVADVVLLARHPQEARADGATDQLVSHVDFPATTLDAAPVGPSHPLAGRSLFRLFDKDSALPPREHLLVGWGPFVLIRTAQWWYNAALWGDEPLPFDLQAGPLLNRNLAKEHPEVVERMKGISISECGNDYPLFFREQADAAFPGCTPLRKW